MNIQSTPIIQNPPYAAIDGQFINGSWRAGRQGGTLKDTEPYTGETLAEIAMANQSDLDERRTGRPPGPRPPGLPRLLPSERP
jgi:hypothetical protein